MNSFLTNGGDELRKIIISLADSLSSTANRRGKEANVGSYIHKAGALSWGESIDKRMQCIGREEFLRVTCLHLPIPPGRTTITESCSCVPLL